MGRLFNHKGAKRLLAIGAVGILGMGVTACGSSSSNSSDSAATGSSLAAAGTTTAPDSEATYPVFEIDAEMPYKFSLPEATAPSGYVQVKLVNNDKQMAHHAQLVKLRDGVTFDKFKTDLTGPMGEGAMMADGTPARRAERHRSRPERHRDR